MAPVSQAKLKWRHVAGDAMSWHVISRDWEALSAPRRDGVMFIGPSRRFAHQPERGFTAYEVQMQYPWAVVLDAQKKGKRRDRITVYNLRTGRARRLEGGENTPPPTTGGTFAMSAGSIAYSSGAANGSGRFCVARAELTSLNGERITCADGHHGYSEISLNGHMLGFDEFNDRRPVSCRTLKYADQSGKVRAVLSAQRCKGWDVLPTPRGSVFWTQVGDETNTNVGEAYARTPNGRVHDLGLTYTGFAIPCGDHIYFPRNSDSDTISDGLMRWSASGGLEKVWTPAVKGQGMIFVPPTCGGTNITIGAIGDGRSSPSTIATAEIDES